MYHSPTPLFQYESRNIAFKVDAQGTLLKVSLLPDLKRQQNNSVSYDARQWSEAKARARAALVKAGTTEGEPFKDVFWRIAGNPPKRLVEYIATQDYLALKRSASTRGRIVEFTRKSRKRLLEHGARLKATARGLFLTFTYRENFQDITEAKRHLYRTLQWLVRHYPEGAYIWRLEYQGRGAIHFHVLALNVRFIKAETLTAYWQELTGDESYPDVKRVRSRRHVMMYISKYLAKTEQASAQAYNPPLGEWVDGAYITPNAGDAGAGSGLVNLPYLFNYTGRFWGVTNRKALPLARQTVFVVTRDGFGAFFELKRYARRRWRRLSRRVQGFSLFVENTGRWLQLIEYILLTE